MNAKKLFQGLIAPKPPKPLSKFFVFVFCSFAHNQRDRKILKVFMFPDQPWAIEKLQPRRWAVLDMAADFLALGHQWSIFCLETFMENIPRNNLFGQEEWKRTV